VTRRLARTLLVGVLAGVPVAWHPAPVVASRGVPAAGHHNTSAPADRLDGQLHFDLLIRNGRVLDGTGNPWQQLDVGIVGDRIRAVGRLDQASASRVIDAEGLHVTPGFIDVHSHAGPGLLDELRHAQPLLAQGITTALVNPDGGGPVDIAGQRAGYERFGVGVNVGLFVPHGSVRLAVMGMSDAAPDSEALAKMIDLVNTGMRAGAVGLSSGLYYAPGSYSETDEVVALASVAARYGGVYASHIRDEGDYSVGVVAAVQEVVTIAEAAGLIGVVTHVKALGPANWGLSMAIAERIEAARSRGVQVYADQYPYNASGTGITGALIPRWALVGGREALVARIRGRERARLLEEVRDNIERRGGPGTLMVGRFPPDPSIEGRTLADLADAGGGTPEATALDLLERSETSLVSFNMSERDIELLMRRPWTMTSTDGDLVPLGLGKPHPRAYGAFPRKIRLYVQERGVIDLPFAIRSMTSLPAAVFGLKDRGTIREGAFADVLVFDPADVRDLATYQDPHQLAEGMAYVVVNGEVVRDAHRFTDRLAGRVVTPERR
jgi:N-acyl-D-aspartate/D-glutamate deacylase